MSELTGLITLVKGMQSQVVANRSTVLQPLLWLCSILFSFLIVAAVYVKIVWVTVMIAVMLATLMIIIFWTYVYCIIKMPDALRSESYTLNKLAIEKGILGDNSSGFTENVIPVAIEQEKKNDSKVLENGSEESAENLK